MPVTLTAGDEAYLARASDGWSTSLENVHVLDGSIRWIVTASKGRRRVEGRGATTTAAWRNALAAAEAPAPGTDWE
jgi:hypothetical protein